MSSPAIQWYPGHIAKAERSLVEQLKRVDVVLEVRDARIPLATHHPRTQHWIGGKERILVMNRVDMIQEDARQQWTDWFKERGETPLYTNAKQGKGVGQIAQTIKQVGGKANQRRRDRGMRPRPVRAVVIGFPNVGKSALINRLLKKKVVASARKPGVTRQLRWIRISDEIELLDAPGVLPSQLKDQDAATHLAICDDIGTAAYDNQRVATALVDRLNQLHQDPGGLLSHSPLQDRYNLAPTGLTGESYLVELAALRHQGDVERTACQILNDFRTGNFGQIALEVPLLWGGAETKGS